MMEQQPPPLPEKSQLPPTPAGRGSRGVAPNGAVQIAVAAQKPLPSEISPSLAKGDIVHVDSGIEIGRSPSPSLLAKSPPQVSLPRPYFNTAFRMNYSNPDVFSTEVMKAIQQRASHMAARMSSHQGESQIATSPVSLSSAPVPIPQHRELDMHSAPTKTPHSPTIFIDPASESDVHEAERKVKHLSLSLDSSSGLLAPTGDLTIANHSDAESKQETPLFSVSSIGDSVPSLAQSGAEFTSLNSLNDDSVSIHSFSTSIAENLSPAYLHGYDRPVDPGALQEYLVSSVKILKTSTKGDRYAAAKFVIENLVYATRENIKEYKDLAIQTLKKLALRGHSDSQFLMGMLYLKGVPGSEKHKPVYSKAHDWFSMAAKKEHGEALYQIGNMYEKGLGVSANITKALHSYRKSCVSLAMIMMQGKYGQPRNIRDGIKWLKLAAKYANSEYPDALYELALLHDQGVRNYIWPDHAYLVSLLSRAIELGHTASMFKMAHGYAKGHFSLQVNPQWSFHYYLMAAERGHVEAQFEVGGFYLTGLMDERTGFVLPRNDALAFEFTRKAAEQLNPKAMFALGYLTERGIGCERNAELAGQYFASAASLGDSKGIEWCKQNGRPVPAAGKGLNSKNKSECIVM